MNTYETFQPSRVSIFFIHTRHSQKCVIIPNYLIGSEGIITTTCILDCRMKKPKPPLPWFWCTETFLVLVLQPWIILNSHSSSSSITYNRTRAEDLPHLAVRYHPLSNSFLEATQLFVCKDCMFLHASIQHYSSCKSSICSTTEKKRRKKVRYSHTD